MLKVSAQAGACQAPRLLGWLGDTLTSPPPWMLLTVTASAPQRADSSLLGGGAVGCVSFPVTHSGCDASALTGSRPPLCHSDGVAWP